MGNCNIILRALIIISSAQEDLFSTYFRNPTKLKGPLVPPPPIQIPDNLFGMIIEEIMVSAHELYDLSSQMGVCELIGNVNLTPHRREQATAISFDL